MRTASVALGLATTLLLAAACTDTSELEERVAALEKPEVTSVIVTNKMIPNARSSPESGEVFLNPLYFAALSEKTNAADTVFFRGYCVTYRLEGVNQDRCVWAPFSNDDALDTAFAPIAAPIRECWDQARIGDPLPDCWR